MLHRILLGLGLALVISAPTAQAGPPDGQRDYLDFFAASDVKTASIDLVGGKSSVTLTRMSGIGAMRVRVVGELTGIEYANQAGFGTVTVTFSHLPVAKMKIIVTNEGGNGLIRTQVY